MLQLAVQGRLVPQEPRDEPSSILLKKIKEEKSELKKSAANEVLEPVITNPFSIPCGWQWVRLGELYLDSFYGPRFNKNEYSKTGIPTIRTTDMTDKGEIILNNPPLIQVDKDRLKTYKLEKDDLLINHCGIYTSIRFQTLLILEHGRLVGVH